MNDDDVLTATRQSFAPVRMETPAKAIMARGATMRRRRTSGRLTAGAMAAALGAGLGASAFAHGGTAQDAALAAWTVQQRPDGTVLLTVRKLDDMAALRARLAPYGVSIATVPSPKQAMVCSFPATAVPAPGHIRSGHAWPLIAVRFAVPPIEVRRAGKAEVFDGAKTYQLPDGHRLAIRFIHVIWGSGKVQLIPLHCVLEPLTPAKPKTPATPAAPAAPATQAS